MTEADFQVKFTRWVTHNAEMSYPYECKITKTGSLPFNALSPHQKDSLWRAKHAVLTHKIADGSGQQTPCDGFVFVNSPAYIVIQYYKRGQKEFFMCDIDEWIKEESISERKSLTEERCRAISTRYELST